MYTVKQVAKKLDISEHTIRFWAKSGLFPFITRDKNNIRIFKEEDLYWGCIIKCLRSSGVDNKSIKKYIDLCIIGDSTIKERYEIIKATRAKAIKKMNELEKQMEILDTKEKYYETLIKNKDTDKLNPMNIHSKFDEFIKSHIGKH